MLDYLNAENDYLDKVLGHTKKFQEDLFEEMKSRIKKMMSPFRIRIMVTFILLVMKLEGNTQSIRKKGSLEAEEEIMFNVNEMAKEHDYYALGGINVSPNNKMVSFGVDTLSRRQYVIQVKNLETGEIYADKIENTTGYAEWANDNKTLFYTKKTL
ncbi:MAG: hypothetical protein R2821_11945 [Flavobacteriaceae bacterium]